MKALSRLSRSCLNKRYINWSLNKRLSSVHPRFCQIYNSNRFFTRKAKNENGTDFNGVRAFQYGDLKLDFANVRIGQELEIPYEVTVSDTWRDIWQSVFYQQDRLFTSKKYVNSIKDNLNHLGIPMPFTMVLFLASSMSHVDDQRVVLDVSFRNCVYNTAVFPGDTLNHTFVIENIRESRNGKNIIVDILCKLYNQNNDMVFQLDKTMYYEKKSINDNKMELPTRDILTISQVKELKKQQKIIYSSYKSNFKHYLLKHQHNLPPSTSLKTLYPREVILHTMQRPLGLETNMTISTMHRMTHPALYNNIRYNSNDEIVVSGPCTIALVNALSGKELYEILYEELADCQLINKCNPNECIGALTYINKVKHLSTVLEEVECCTLGIKNCDITQELDGIKIPLSLFEPGLKPTEVEAVCNDYIPQLKNKIVAQSTRRLIRKIPPNNPIPLL